MSKAGVLASRAAFMTVAGAAGGWALLQVEETSVRIRESKAYWKVADASAWALRTLVQDAETAHELAIKSMKLGLAPVAPKMDTKKAEMLETRILGQTFKSPIGVAAGFDKKAHVVDALGMMGFGFVEVGGVTVKPQNGNPRPRIFRVPDYEAVINRVGLPSDGVDQVLGYLQQVKTTPVGVNCAKQQDISDYATVAGKVAPHVGFIVINASCPNVKGGVVADLNDIAKSIHLVKEAVPHTTPVLLKISPDLDDSELKKIARAAQKADGLVVANTTKKRPGSLKSPEQGGLSGRPLFHNTRHLVSQVYSVTGGTLPIIGVGGVSTASDAYALIRAGASLVQLYTGLVYQGPSAIHTMHSELASLAANDGFPSVQAAVGADHSSSSSSSKKKRRFFFF